jgi:hypothetical protein
VTFVSGAEMARCAHTRTERRENLAGAFVVHCLSCGSVAPVVVTCRGCGLDRRAFPTLESFKIHEAYCVMDP